MVRAQQTVGEAVKGADPHAALAGADQLLDTVTHLRRRFVGKSHRHDRIGRAVLYREQPGDAVHQDARFSAACACQHQQVAARRRHGFALFVIQTVEQIRNVHRHRSLKKTKSEP